MGRGFELTESWDTPPDRRKRRLRRLTLAAVAVLVVLIGLDAGWVALSAPGALESAREDLERATDALLAGDLTEAERAFGAGGQAADRGEGFMNHPATWIADILPFVGDDVDAVQALAHASSEIAYAGPALIRAAGAAGWNGMDLTELMEDGRIRLDVLRSSADLLRRAADHVGEAQEALASVSTQGLFGRVATAVTDARHELSRGVSLVSTAAELSDLLPSFLGGEGPRRYFLALQNLSAPRGTGGFLGMYGILEADDGEFRLAEFAGVGGLGRVPPVDASEDAEQRYARFGGVTRFIAANYSPDFPTAARTVLAMWEASGRPPLDGVIGTDPILMAYLLGVIGPVSTPAWPEPLTSENVSNVVHRDTFLLDSHAASDQAQEQFGLAFWRAALERAEPGRGLAEALSRALRERHLQIYSDHADEQDLLGRLGASGQVRLGENPLFVVWQDAVGSRSGFYAIKSTVHRVTIAPDGSAQVATEVTLENTAPEGPPSLLLGFGDTGDPVGFFGAYLNVYLPADATGIRSRVDGKAGPLQLIEREFGRPVVFEFLGAPPQESSTLAVTYQVPNAVTTSGGVTEYRLQLLPQPALRPGNVVVEITVPEGMEVSASAPLLSRRGATWRYEGTPTVPQWLWIRFRP